VSHDERPGLYRQLRADQPTLSQAAECLPAGHPRRIHGIERKDIASGLALILDEIARHRRDIDDDGRRRLVEACVRVLNEAARRFSTTPHDATGAVVLCRLDWPGDMAGPRLARDGALSLRPPLSGLSAYKVSAGKCTRAVLINSDDGPAGNAFGRWTRAVEPVRVEQLSEEHRELVRGRLVELHGKGR
jgi:hypothetical protein